MCRLSTYTSFLHIQRRGLHATCVGMMSSALAGQQVKWKILKETTWFLGNDSVRLCLFASVWLSAWLEGRLVRKVP